MERRPRLAGIALLLTVLLLLIPTGSAAGTGISDGEFPELVPGDPTPVYVWNVPLKLILLDFVFMAAPLLFLPVQILIAASAWFCLNYRRISRKNALEHDSRRAAYFCIRDNPGINHASLSRRLGMNVGTLRYHLETLCETGKIVAESDHGLLRYYVNGESVREEEETGYLLSETRRRILDLIVQDPGITRKEVASALGIAGTSVGWHVALLIRESAVRSEKDGRTVRYFPGQNTLQHSRADEGVSATGQGFTPEPQTDMIPE